METICSAQHKAHVDTAQAARSNVHTALEERQVNLVELS